VQPEEWKLATEAAKATVEAAVRLAPKVWQPIKQRIVSLWGAPANGPDADEAREAADRLDDPATRAGRADDFALWAVRYSALLQKKPDSADDLRTLIGDITKASSQTSTRGDVVTVITGRSWFNRQVVQSGDGNTFIRSGTVVGVGLSTLLVLTAALVAYLVVRPETTLADLPKAGASNVSAAPAVAADSCGHGLPAIAEPPDGSDDPSVGQSYSYKVGSASGDGRDMRAGGSIRQAFVAGRAYVSQVSAIVGVGDSRAHPIEFRLQRLDGTVLMDAVENEVPANNNKDVVHNIVPAVPVTPREVLFLTVTNKAHNQVRFFVDPPISNEVPVLYAACITGQAQMPERHVDLRGNILAGSVMGQDVR
jgi:hypothetical protein